MLFTITYMQEGPQVHAFTFSPDGHVWDHYLSADEQLLPAPALDSKIAALAAAQIQTPQAVIPVLIRTAMGVDGTAVVKTGT